MPTKARVNIIYLFFNEVKVLGQRNRPQDFLQQAGGVVELHQRIAVFPALAPVGFDDPVIVGFNAARAGGVRPHDVVEIGLEIVGERHPAGDNGPLHGFLAEVFLGTAFEHAQEIIFHGTHKFDGVRRAYFNSDMLRASAAMRAGLTGLAAKFQAAFLRPLVETAAWMGQMASSARFCSGVNSVWRDVWKSSTGTMPCLTSSASAQSNSVNSSCSRSSNSCVRSAGSLSPLIFNSNAWRNSAPVRSPRMGSSAVSSASVL